MKYIPHTFGIRFNAFRENRCIYLEGGEAPPEPIKPDEKDAELIKKADEKADGGVMEKVKKAWKDGKIELEETRDIAREIIFNLVELLPKEELEKLKARLEGIEEKELLDLLEKADIIKRTVYGKSIETTFRARNELWKRIAIALVDSKSSGLLVTMQTMERKLIGGEISPEELAGIERTIRNYAITYCGLASEELEMVRPKDRNELIDFLRFANDTMVRERVFRSSLPGHPHLDTERGVRVDARWDEDAKKWTDIRATDRNVAREEIRRTAKEDVTSTSRKSLYSLDGYLHGGSMSKDALRKKRWRDADAREADELREKKDSDYLRDKDSTYGVSTHSASSTTTGSFFRPRRPSDVHMERRDEKSFIEKQSKLNIENSEPPTPERMAKEFHLPRGTCKVGEDFMFHCAPTTGRVTVEIDGVSIGISDMPFKNKRGGFRLGEGGTVEEIGNDPIDEQTLFVYGWNETEDDIRIVPMQPGDYKFLYEVDGKYTSTGRRLSTGGVLLGNDGRFTMRVMQDDVEVEQRLKKGDTIKKAVLEAQGTGGNWLSLGDFGKSKNGTTHGFIVSSEDGNVYSKDFSGGTIRRFDTRSGNGIVLQPGPDIPRDVLQADIQWNKTHQAELSDKAKEGRLQKNAQRIEQVNAMEERDGKKGEWHTIENGVKGFQYRIDDKGDLYAINTETKQRYGFDRVNAETVVTADVAEVSDKGKISPLVPKERDKEESTSLNPDPVKRLSTLIREHDVNRLYSEEEEDLVLQYILQIANSALNGKGRYLAQEKEHILAYLSTLDAQLTLPHNAGKNVIHRPQNIYETLAALINHIEDDVLNTKIKNSRTYKYCFKEWQVSNSLEDEAKKYVRDNPSSSLKEAKTRIDLSEQRDMIEWSTKKTRQKDIAQSVGLDIKDQSKWSDSDFEKYNAEMKKQYSDAMDKKLPEDSDTTKKDNRVDVKEVAESKTDLKFDENLYAIELSKVDPKSLTKEDFGALSDMGNAGNYAASMLLGKAYIAHDDPKDAYAAQAWFQTAEENAKTEVGRETAKAGMQKAIEIIRQLEAAQTQEALEAAQKDREGAEVPSNQEDEALQTFFPDATIENGIVTLKNTMFISKNIPEGVREIHGTIGSGTETPITHLPESLTRITGKLNLSFNSKLTSLGGLREVGGDLDLIACTNMIALPERLHVGGDLKLHHATAVIPNNLHVDGDLRMGYAGTAFTFGSGVEIGGNIALEPDQINLMLDEALQEIDRANVQFGGDIVVYGINNEYLAKMRTEFPKFKNHIINGGDSIAG